MVTRSMVLRAKDLMNTQFLTVDERRPILEVAREMAESHQGYALVARAGKAFGIVTEWDFLARVLAAALDPTTPVGAIASSPLVACDAETPTDELLRRMAELGVRRMLLTRSGEVVGVVAAKEVIASFQRYIDQLSADIARFQAPPS
ncbi:MAG TPA: CBS domain-containing protein [Thermoplasmata archaeon]|nr:CBS domain-containing protein [Thermoplasmata archaeon]